MTLDLEALLVALAFVLPGFVTSKLVVARTPSVSREISAFEQTLESLLRSLSIHLILAPLVLVFVRFCLLQDDSALLAQVYAAGVQAYGAARPFEASAVLLGWLISAFVVAVLFGSIWDPTHALLERLATRTGTLSEDPFYLLRQKVANRRKQGHPHAQLWVQARLKNGHTYRGELMVAGYRDEDKSREFLLANAKFFPYVVQAGGEKQSPPKFAVSSPRSWIFRCSPSVQAWMPMANC